MQESFVQAWKNGILWSWLLIYSQESSQVKQDFAVVKQVLLHIKRAWIINQVQKACHACDQIGTSF